MDAIKRRELVFELIHDLKQGLDALDRDVQAMPPVAFGDGHLPYAVAIYAVVTARMTAACMQMCEIPDEQWLAANLKVAALVAGGITKSKSE